MDKENQPDRKWTHRFVFAGFAFSGAAALIYEVVWTEHLGQIMGSSTYALSTILAAFMAGLSLGGWLGAGIVKKARNLPIAFALCEFGIGLAGIMLIHIIESLMPLYMESYYSFHISFSLFSVAQFLLVFLITGLPTTLMGMTFPIVVRYISSGSTAPSSQVGRLYSINTLGAVTGTLAAGLGLIPLLGVRGAELTAAALNIFTAFGLLLLTRQFVKVLSFGFVVFMALNLTSIFNRTWIPFFSYYSGYRFQSYEFAKSVNDFIDNSRDNYVIYHYEGLGGEVSLIRLPSEGYALINNGKLEEGDTIGFRLLSYLPYYTHSTVHKKMKALNIGLGSGHSLKALVSFPFSTIDSIELNEGIIEANRRFLSPELFQDPRIKHIVADGRNFLLLGTKKYDIIVASPSWAVEQASAGLLTDEFFSLAASRLHDSGVFAIWVDYFMMNDEDLEVLLRTFSHHFTNSEAWHVDGDGMIMIGMNHQPKNSPEEVYSAIVSSTPQLDGTFRLAFSDEDIARIPPGEINTDNLPLLEFQNARHIISGHNKHMLLTKRKGKTSRRISINEN